MGTPVLPKHTVLAEERVQALLIYLGTDGEEHQATVTPVVERNSERRITRMKHALQAKDYTPTLEDVMGDDITTFPPVEKDLDLARQSAQASGPHHRMGITSSQTERSPTIA